MGHITEPKGVDLFVDPMPLSKADREAISTAIATYRQTGEIPKVKPKPKVVRGEKAAKPRKKGHVEAPPA